MSRDSRISRMAPLVLAGTVLLVSPANSWAAAPASPAPSPAMGLQLPPGIPSQSPLTTLTQGVAPAPTVAEALPVLSPEVTKAETNLTPLEPRTLSDEEVIERLRTGRQTGLTISDLAAVNDMLKRLEYQLEIERKMSEMGMGGTTAPASSSSPILPGLPADFSLGSAPSAPSSSPAGEGTASADVIPEGLHVAQVSGRQGRYTAVLVVRQGGRVSRDEVAVGDEYNGKKVIGVDLTGVRLRDESGTELVPFRPHPLLVTTRASN